MTKTISIGIDSFAYHRYFGETTAWEKPLEIRWQVGDFLQRAASLGIGTVSLQTVYLPNLTLHTADALRDQLAQFNLKPVLAWGHRNGLEGGTSSQKVESLLALLPVARRMGCSLVRLVNGDQFWWPVSAQERIARLIPILRTVAMEAARLGLTLAAENHADFTMRDLVTLIDSVGADNLGICFDSGNAVRVGDDLLEAATLAGKRIRMVHLKDMMLLDEDRGHPDKWWPAAPLGCGKLDLRRFVDILRGVDYGGALYIEMANMYPDFANEDAAVAQSVAYLNALLGA